MFRYALYTYTPQKRMRRTSFEDMDLSRRILMFKDGRKVATTWAAEEMAKAMRLMNLTDTVIVCVPASCQHTYTRRFKRFSKTLCQRCGAENGFTYVKVNGHRDKMHRTSHQGYTLANIEINGQQLRRKKVVIIDDIVTTGHTADTFAQMIQGVGADVRMTLFLAKTKSYNRDN